MFRDLVTVTRRLWREPRFTAAVILTLALGLGANLTVFTFVDAFLIAPLPVPQPGELLRVSQDRDGGSADLASYPNYRDGRDASRAVIDLAAHTQTMALVGPPDAGEVRAIEVVSGNYFRVLRLVPQAGRLLNDADDLAELASPVVVISDGFWRARLGGRSDAIGAPLYINGARFEVVGVAPAGFHGTFAAHSVDVWAPITMQQHVRPRGLSIDRRAWGWLWMIGRLTPGHGPEDARRALAAAADGVNRQFPSRPADALAYVVQPVSALSVGDQARLTPVLLTAFAFTGLLFIATCANLAGLMHARVAARRKELAVRQSLGAGRLRLMWEWMVECTVLALAGGVAALVVARVTAETLGAVELPRQLLGDLSFDTTLQWRVALYTLGVSLLGALLFGASSAWRAARQVPVEALKEEGGNSSGGRRSVRARRAMVTVQVGVSVVLLMLASLLTTSLRRQQQASTGFDTSVMGVLSVHLQRQRVPEGEWPALTQRALDAARAVPGVAATDLGLRAPLEQGEDVQTIRVPGYDPQHEADGLSIDFNQVGPQYFETLGLRFASGGPWDPRSGAPAVVINHTMASRYWPAGTDPVGRTVLIGRTPATVSGVVADSSYYNVGEPPRPFIYLPAHIQRPGGFVLHVRAARGTDPAALMTVVAKALAGADPRLAPFDVMAFDELRQVPLFPTRLLTMAALVFGVVSVILTAVGLYGVIAASVSARTREIGVRLALGAQPDRVQRGIIGEALTLAAVGGAAGLGAGYLAAYQLRAWLFGVAPFDLAVTLGVVATVAVLAMASAWVPARRAARVDPVRAMR